MLDVRGRPQLAVVLALIGVGGCADEPLGEGEEDDASAIIGGNAEAGHPSVALLRGVVSVTSAGEIDEIFTCTATVIAPGVLLTAAHCLRDDFLWTDLSFGAKPNRAAPRGTAGWFPTKIIPHPSYAWSTHATEGHDVAVVLCDGVDGVTPPSIRRGPTPPVGTNGLVVGYGRMTFAKSDDDGRGEKRSASLPIVGATPHELVAGTEGLSTCNGDSGGPLLVKGAIVAVTSYGKVSCRTAGHFMRVDDNLTFIRRYAPSF